MHIAAEKVPSAHIVCGDAHELPWDDSTFDMVLLECVLTILSYPELALKEACRVLRPGGWLIISTLYDKTNSGSHELVERGLISVSVLEDALEDHGLTIVDDRECSDCLKQFFGDVIFRFGSLEAYIRSATALIGSTVLQCDIPVRRCGYMLVISQKR